RCLLSAQALDRRLSPRRRSTSISTSALRHQEGLLRFRTSTWALGPRLRRSPRRVSISISVSAETSQQRSGPRLRRALSPRRSPSASISICRWATSRVIPPRQTLHHAPLRLLLRTSERLISILEYRQAAAKREPRPPRRPRWIWPTSVWISVRPAAATVQTV